MLGDRSARPRCPAAEPKSGLTAGRAQVSRGAADDWATLLPGLPIMALRLTGSTLAPAAPPGAAALAARATTLLDSGDLPGYRELFARAAEHEHPQERYRARVALLEQGLGAAGRAPAARAAQIFLLVAGQRHGHPRGGAERAGAPQPRRRRLLRAVEPRRGQGAVHSGAAPRSDASPRRRQPERDRARRQRTQRPGADRSMRRWRRSHAAASASRAAPRRRRACVSACA